MRITILGGGFGGVYTAQRLFARCPSSKKLDLTLISRRPYFEFKPLFPEVLAERLLPESARFPLDGLFSKSDCAIKIAEVTGIDLKKRRVNTTKGGVNFDYLVIALGGATESIPVEKGAKVYPFESLNDCIILRDRVAELMKRQATSRRRSRRESIAVIGAGPTGLEIAFELHRLLNIGQTNRKGTPSRLGAIFLITATAKILEGWGQDLRETAEQILAQTDIHVLKNSLVSKVAQRRISVKGKHSLPADITVWAGGTKGLELYRSLGVPLDEKGRIRVNLMLQLSRHKNVYAIGDSINTEAFAMPVSQSAQAAYQQASLVARNIRNTIEGKQLKKFRYLELGQAMPVGGRRAIAHAAGVSIEGYSAWALEKALFVYRVPGLRNKLKLFHGLAVEPLVKRGAEYLEERGARKVLDILNQ